MQHTVIRPGFPGLGSIPSFSVPGPVVTAGAGILAATVQALLSNQNPPGGSAGFPQPDFNGNGCPTIPDKRFKICPSTGQLIEVKKRRRRRRLLSCGDKADIGFIIGQLGKGTAGTAAISAIMARCA